MWSSKRTIYFLFAIFLAAACVPEPESNPVYELGGPDLIRHLEKDGGSAIFTIYSNGVFTGEVNDDWISVEDFPGVSKFSLEGDTAVTLNCGHNAGDTRKGSVTLSLGNRSIDLTIIQRGELTKEAEVTALPVAASSSTLTFSWVEGESVEDAYLHPYTFGLYRDEACEDLVVSYSVEGGSSIWSKKQPVFTFGGLSSDTEYWFKVVDTENLKTSDAVSGKTDAFSIVRAGDADAAEGAVILAEDFSELSWYGDSVDGGAGVSPEGGFGNNLFESPIDSLSSVLEGSRLAEWAAYAQRGAADNRSRMVFARPGYVKLGGYSWCSALVSPPLGSIPEGKMAKVKVSFTASRYSSDNEGILVSAVEGSTKNHSFTLKRRSDVQRNLEGKVSWNIYSVELDEVVASSRIMIGPDWESAGTGLGKSQHRMFISDITVTLVSISDDTRPEITNIAAELTASSSSTLTFRWGEGETVSEMYSHPYNFGLYKDEACKDLVVSYSVEGASTIWDKKQPAFTFAGLESGSTYYFKVTDPETYEKSMAIPGTTDSFTVVQPGTVDAVEGAVLLAEDFSEIPWYGDYVIGAAGWRAEDLSAFKAPSGENPAGSFGNSGYEALLFDALGDAVSGSRLSLWSALGQDGAADNRSRMVFARSGYVKLGGYSWCSALVSPELGSIPAGKVAGVKVTFTASRHGSDNTEILVSLVHGSTSGHSFTAAERSDVNVNLESEVGWKTYSVEFSDVRAASRIMIGPDWAATGKGYGKSQHRMYISDITVELTSIEEDTRPKNLIVENILYREADVRWSDTGASSYNVYLDNALAATVDTPYYHLSGLESGSAHTLAVGAVGKTGERLSDEVNFTLKKAWQVEASPTSLCVEWDDVSGSTLWSGQDRAYEMALYADEACTQELLILCPFDGVKTDYFAFNDGRYSATSTTYWNGLVNGVPRQTRTRISIGCLKPSTSYWFKVRSRAEVSLVGKDGSTSFVLTNKAGDSEWSSPIELKTADAHTPSSGEVIFQGFDRYSIQRDLHNQCPGIQPVLSTEERLTFSGADLPFSGEIRLNTFGAMGDAYSLQTFGFAKRATGTENNYFTGASWNDQQNYIDEDGWHYGLSRAIYPEMGYIQIESTKELYIGTPALMENLNEEASACTLSFKGFANFSSYNTTTSKALKLKIVHADGTVDDVSCPGIPYAFENASPSTTNFVYDTSWKVVSVDVNLKKGDAVVIVNNASNRFMIDDILIVKK